jgi:hypothetical protein
MRTKLTRGLIVVNIDPLKLKVAVTDVFALWIYSMFVGNDLPELIGKAQETHLKSSLSSYKRNP